MLTKPTSIYINWAAYDELSDTVELDEKLALRQLEELLRLRELGVRFDAYLMDCFWFAADTGFRTWRQPHWPDGPERWLNRCAQTGVLPGLWFQVNAMVHPNPKLRMRAIPEWYDSIDGTPEESWSMCLFYGGYLAHFIESLHLWYERGVRVFKFDFANFDSAPRHLKAVMLPSEIRSANVTAFQGAMRSFRKLHPEALLLAYNGFEEAPVLGNTFAELRKVMDERWLGCFDSLYCGDPRPADVPAMNFWRSKDVYSDHTTRYFMFNEIPVSRIDNTGFMIGLTGTCYYRGTAAWKGMLLLSLARGGWANTYYGNLELLDADKAAWFARAQTLFYSLQADATFSALGDMPGAGQPYGFLATMKSGAVATVVNPSQEILSIVLPEHGSARLLFRDAGFEPLLENGRIILGPEQLALVGLGSFANAKFDLGVQDDVTIPSTIEKIQSTFTPDGEKAIAAQIAVPAQGDIRVVLRQKDAAGNPRRTSGGAPPGGRNMAEILVIEARQGDRNIALRLNYDKVIWSGLSWAVAEIPGAFLDRALPVKIRCHSLEPDSVQLHAELYRVEYGI